MLYVRRKLFPVILFKFFIILLYDFSLTSDLEIIFSAMTTHAMNICAKFNYNHSITRHAK